MVYTPHSWWFFGMVNCWVLYGFVGFTTLLLNGKVNCFCLLWTHIFWNQFCKSTCNHTYFIAISFITNGPRTRIISSPYSCCLYSMGASWNGWMQLTLELASFMALLHGFAAGWLCSLPLCASTPQYSQSYQTSLAAASTPMPLGAWRSPEVHRWGNTPMDSTQQNWIDWPLGNNNSSSTSGEKLPSLLSLPNCRLVCLGAPIFGPRFLAPTPEINPSCHSSAHPIGD